MSKTMKKKVKKKEELETDHFRCAHALKTFIERKGLWDEFNTFYYSTDYTFPFNQAKDMQSIFNTSYIPSKKEEKLT